MNFILPNGRALISFTLPIVNIVKFFMYLMKNTIGMKWIEPANICSLVFYPSVLDIVDIEISCDVMLRQ